MKVGVVTLFPGMFEALNYGVMGRALKNQLVTLQCWNPRDFTHDKYRTVDDKPYGGGPGMLMKVQPLQDAIRTAKAALGQATKVVYMTPKGRRFDQQTALAWSQRSQMIFVSGRYEGIDARLLETDIDEQWSIGDYVVSGGELPIMAILDAVIRLIPGVLGDAQSAQEESFMHGLLDHPHYTRPLEVDGLRVPEVLLSGHHREIERWRLKQALAMTARYRPDLLEQLEPNELQKELLDEIKR